MIQQDGVACTGNMAIHPAENSIASSGGTLRVYVESPAACSWTAESESSWITVESGQTGSGSGYVEMTVDPNTGSARRLGAVTIAGQSYTVTQDYPLPPECSVSASPTSLNFPYTASSQTVLISSNLSTCEWTASADSASWVDVSDLSGSGGQTVTVSVMKNIEHSPREATIYVAGQTITVTQAESTEDCAFSTWPANGGWAFGAEADEAEVDVSASPGTCEWTTANNLSWISLVPSSGTGSQPVKIVAQRNTNAASRSGSITIAGTTFSVSQEGVGGSGCTYTLDKAYLSAVSDSKEYDIAVTTDAACTYEGLESHADWITPTAGTGTCQGSGTVSFRVAENTANSSRTGVVTVAGQSVTVNQAAAPAAACSYIVSPGSLTIGASGGSKFLAVETSSSCAWTISNVPSWITLSKTSGTGADSFIYWIDANTSTTSRRATLSVAGKSVSIVQYGVGSTCSNVILYPDHHDFIADGSSVNVEVNASSDSCEWVVTNLPSWVSVSRGVRPGGPDAGHHRRAQYR